MKYLTEIQSKDTIYQSQGELILSKELYGSESQKNTQILKIQTEKDQNLQTVNMKIKFTQRSYKGLKIDDLVDMISKSTKSEIIKTSKLFQQLGFLLNQEPIKILDIKPSKGFVSNLAEYTRKIGEKQNFLEKNPMKVCKVFLNSLFYIVMLIISGGKEKHVNEKLRQKLFNNKTFLKNLLLIDIYDRKQISKIYIMIVTYIYKSKPSQPIKKKLAFSIIRNLKHFNGENSKTTLNLLMILNELKFQFNLKQTQVQQYNLIETTENIFQTNKQFFQSVNALKYYLHLVYEFPQLDKRPTSNLIQKIQLTQEVKKFIMYNISYQKTYLRYLEHSLSFAAVQELQKLSENTLNGLFQFFNLKQNIFMIGNLNWIQFLLNVIKILVKSVKNHQILLWMINKGLITRIVEIIKSEQLDSNLQNQLLQVLKACLNQLQNKFPNIYFSLVSTIFTKIKETKQKQVLNITPKNFFLNQLSSKISKLSFMPLELE